MRRLANLIIFLSVCIHAQDAAAQCSVRTWAYGRAGEVNFCIYDASNPADMLATCSSVDGNNDVLINWDGTEDALDTTTITDNGQCCQISISAEEASPTNLEETLISFQDATASEVYPGFCIVLDVRLSAPTNFAQGGTSTTIQLAAAEDYEDDALFGAEVCVNEGPAEGECFCVSDYVKSTDTVTIDGTYIETPTTSSAYFIRPNSACRGVEASSLSSTATASVNAEVVDVFETDTVSELSSCPGATLSRSDQLMYLYQYFRNKQTATSSLQTLFKDDESTGLCEQSLSDDGATFTKGEGAVP